jgi:hypothetical protein
LRNFHALSATLILLASATALTPGLAQSDGSQENDSKSSSEPSKVEAEAKDDEMVCRKIALTGTRVGQRVCRTRAQWDAVAKAARESANTLKDAGGINTTPTPGN